MVVVDTNIVNCLLSAMRDGDLPRTNDTNIRAEQVATFRLFLWADLGAVGRIAANEVSKHPNEEKRGWLESIVFVQLPEVWVQDEDLARWQARTVKSQVACKSA